MTLRINRGLKRGFSKIKPLCSCGCGGRTNSYRYEYMRGHRKKKSLVYSTQHNYKEFNQEDLRKIRI